MSFAVQLDSEKYDQAKLRVACAMSLLTVITTMLDGECDSPSNTVLSTALYGVGLLIEDADKQLAGNSLG